MPAILNDLFLKMYWDGAWFPKIFTGPGFLKLYSDIHLQGNHDHELFARDDVTCPPGVTGRKYCSRNVTFIRWE